MCDVYGGGSSADYGGGDRTDANYHDADYDQSLEEELSEILEAFYSMISEEEIQQYQKFVEDCEGMKISKESIDAPDYAPEFELLDQDGELISLKHLLEKGPVVLVFYRGNWCPQCNATIMRYQKHLDQIQAKGAQLLAISPMLPDGTAVFSSKGDLQFPVLSDVGNKVARKFKITFTVPEDVRPKMIEWGHDLPAHNGDETWEIPIPSSYVISRTGEIVWAYVNEDPSNRGEPTDVVAAIPYENEEEKKEGEAPATKTRKKKDGSILKQCLSMLLVKGSIRSVFKKKKSSKKQLAKEEPIQGKEETGKGPKTKFGKEGKEAGEFLGQYLLKE